MDIDAQIDPPGQAAVKHSLISEFPRVVVLMATSQATFSIASIVAIVAAILSFQVGPLLGLLLAALALICGAIGLVLALSPGIRGGVVSIIAVVLSIIGVIAAIVKAIMWFF